MYHIIFNIRIHKCMTIIASITFTLFATFLFPAGGSEIQNSPHTSPHSNFQQSEHCSNPERAGNTAESNNFARRNDNITLTTETISTTYTDPNNSTILNLPESSTKSNIIAYLALKNARRNLDKTRQILKPRPEPENFPDMQNKEISVKLSDLLTTIDFDALPQQIPPQLQQHINNIMDIAKSSPDLAFAIASSLCTRWNKPTHTDFIFEQVMQTCRKEALYQDLEMAVILFRSFLNKLNSEDLRNRAALRIGRLYYENGLYAKTIAEINIDRNIQNPPPAYTLSAMIKAMALIRTRNSEQALPLFEWVAKKTSDVKQKARAAFVAARIHLIYQRYKKAKTWLIFVAHQIHNKSLANAAAKLLKDPNIQKDAENED